MMFYAKATFGFILLWSVCAYPQDVLPVTITLTTSVQADAKGHTMQMDKGYFADSPEVKVWLMCDDAKPTCIPLRPGQTYQTKKLFPEDRDYAYGYACKSDKQCIITRVFGKHDGKSVDAVYVIGSVQ